MEASSIRIFLFSLLTWLCVIYPGEALYPIFGKQAEGFLEFRFT